MLQLRDSLAVDRVNAIVEKNNMPSVRILENSRMEFISEYEEEDTNNIVRLYTLDEMA
ncbi:hypothetical protein WMO40_00245 [Bacillaceae bacterium CLA-AA-H227]|uniref:Uncharacterized protein n=1 Tax=Robertmurraya yapensis (ex Hitch et al 2024) TaxID=3133160 RepID=A0ACC6S5B9_9BACI